MNPKNVLDKSQKYTKILDILATLLMLGLAVYFFFTSDDWTWLYFVIGAIFNALLVTFNVSKRIQDAMLSRVTRKT